MDGDKRSVDCTPQDFLAAWGAETPCRRPAVHHALLPLPRHRPGREAR
jgi:hypothetical protein